MTERAIYYVEVTMTMTTRGHFHLSEQIATSVKELAQIAAGWTRLEILKSSFWSLFAPPKFINVLNNLTKWQTALPNGNQRRLSTVIWKEKNFRALKNPLKR